METAIILVQFAQDAHARHVSSFWLLTPLLVAVMTGLRLSLNAVK